jgi:hypothetical protein
MMKIFAHSNGEGGDMSQRSVLVVGVLFGSALLSACETAPSGMGGGGVSSQREAARAVMDYRKLAAELREMAQRRALEADVLAKQSNPDQAMIAHWREMAQSLNKEAEAAEQHAREMQRNVPHGMMQ